MVYNLSFIANQSGYVPFIKLVNERLMFGWFGVGILVTLFCILYISFIKRTNDNAGSAGAASFIVSCMSLLLFAMGLIEDYYVLVSWILSAVMLALLYFRD